MKLKTPLERAIEALDGRIKATNPGHRREGMEYALALCRSFEEYDPEHDHALYTQGFTDARRIYTNTQKPTTNETEALNRRDEDSKGLALQG